MPLTDDEAEAFYLQGWRDAVAGQPEPTEVQHREGTQIYYQGYLDGKGAFECAVKSFRATRSAARTCVRSA